MATSDLQKIVIFLERIAAGSPALGRLMLGAGQLAEARTRAGSHTHSGLPPRDPSPQSSAPVIREHRIVMKLP